MKPLDEIVFENRNKEYGSYILRKKYGNFLLTSMAIGIFLLGILIAFPVIANYLHKDKTNDIPAKVIVDVTLAPKIDAYTPPPPPIEPEVRVQKFIAPIIVDEYVESTLGIQDELATAKPLSPENNRYEFVIPDVPPTKVIEQTKQPEYFLIVQEQPHFNGDLVEYISRNIKYPQEAKELGIEGKIFVTFIVEVDGSISSIEVLRGIGGGCDEEAVRVVKSMPNWTPGRQGGVAVRVKLNLPIKFTLQ